MVDMGQADRTLYRCGNTNHNEDVFKRSREKQRRLREEENKRIGEEKGEVTCK